MNLVGHIVFSALAVLLLWSVVRALRNGVAEGFWRPSRTGQPMQFGALVALNVLIAVGLLYYHLPPLIGVE